MKVYINFADEKYEKVRKLNTESVRKFCFFDKIIEYKPEDIDQDFFKKNTKILLNSRGCGLWLWKPYFIKKTLEKMKEGDILFYCDAATVFIHDCDSVFEILKTADTWITVLPLVEKQWTQKRTFEIMEAFSEEFTETRQYSGTFLAFKKTNFTMAFVDEWLRYAQIPECIIPEKINQVEDSSFISHREDQSILSILCKKYKIYPYSDPSQYGKFQQAYCAKNRLMLFNESSDYRPFILHHRLTKFSCLDLLKLYLVCIIPNDLLITLKNIKLKRFC